MASGVSVLASCCYCILHSFIHEPQGCPCLWHPVAIAERESHLLVCRTWPGPVCGSCWSTSCACGYVFDAVADAHARWPNGRLRCTHGTPSAALSERVIAPSSKPPPAPAPGGPLADARERLRTPHPHKHVIVGVGPGPAWYRSYLTIKKPDILSSS